MGRTTQGRFATWLGIAIVIAVILVFLGLTSCQPDFFRGMTLVQ